MFSCLYNMGVHETRFYAHLVGILSAAFIVRDEGTVLVDYLNMRYM